MLGRRRPRPKPATPLVRGVRPLRVELTCSQLVSGTGAPGARAPVALSTAFWRRPPVHGTGPKGRSGSEADIRINALLPVASCARLGPSRPFGIAAGGDCAKQFRNKFFRVIGIHAMILVAMRSTIDSACKPPWANVAGRAGADNMRVRSVVSGGGGRQRNFGPGGQRNPLIRLDSAKEIQGFFFDFFWPGFAG
jgi:hypothetical protein